MRSLFINIMILIFILPFFHNKVSAQSTIDSIRINGVYLIPSRGTLQVLEYDTENIKTTTYFGQKVYVFKTKIDSNSSINHFPDSLSNGKWIAFFKNNPNQPALILNYKGNKLNGKFYSFYCNGNIWEMGNYLYGKLNGAYYIFYKNGTIAQEEHLIYGNRYGKFIWYYKNGKIRQKAIYLNNIPQ